VVEDVDSLADGLGDSDGDELSDGGGDGGGDFDVDGDDELTLAEGLPDGPALDGSALLLGLPETDGFVVGVTVMMPPSPIETPGIGDFVEPSFT